MYMVAWLRALPRSPQNLAGILSNGAGVQTGEWANLARQVESVMAVRQIWLLARETDLQLSYRHFPSPAALPVEPRALDVRFGLSSLFRFGTGSTTQAAVNRQAQRPGMTQPKLPFSLVRVFLFAHQRPRSAAQQRTPGPTQGKAACRFEFVVPPGSSGWVRLCDLPTVHARVCTYT